MNIVIEEFLDMVGKIERILMMVGLMKMRFYLKRGLMNDWNNIESETIN